MSRILLVLPTETYRASDFVDAARRLGAEVVVASEQRQALAEQMGERALEIDLCDREGSAGRIAALHERHPLDAVLPVDDQGVVIVAIACERLGLAHNPVESVRATRDKAELRRRLTGAGMRQPRFEVASPEQDAGAVAEEIGFPVVVKAPSLAASRGVIRGDDAGQAHAAAERVRRILDDPSAAVLVEEYIPGEEFAVEGLLRDGTLEVLAVFDKPDLLEGPYFEETIYVTPSRLPEPDLLDLQAAVAAACEAIGLRTGPVHAEARMRDGRPWVLEVASRSIGGLCSRVLTFGLGMSLEEVLLRHALGRPLGRLSREPQAAGVMMLPIPAEGVLTRVDGREEASAVPGIVGLEITATMGKPIRPLPEGDRYLGFLFSKAATPEQAEAALREAHGRLDVVITPRASIG